METSRVNMRDLLSHGLYLMMQEKPFDKITIKSICDKTGVIRGTFYNHFMDKYECLEYLTFQMIIGNKVNTYNNEEELMKGIIYSIHEHKDFFLECFKISGQNSFSSMLENIFFKLLMDKVSDLKDKYQNVIVNKRYLSKYIANNIVFIIEEWIVHDSNRNVEEMIIILETLSNFNIMRTKNNK